MPEKPEDDLTISQESDSTEVRPESNADSQVEHEAQADKPAHGGRRKDRVGAREVDAMAPMEEEADTLEVPENEADDAATPKLDGDLTASIAEIEKNRLAQLRRAIVNAQSLLAFSAESNVEVPDPVISSITAAQRAFGTDAWNPDIEGKFWSAFREISGLLLPVTSSSLQWFSKRGRMNAITFISLGILSLVLLIWGQIFWVYINNTSTQIRSSIQTLNQKTAQLVELEGAVTMLKRQLETSIGATRVEDIEQFQQRLIESEGKIDALQSEVAQLKRLLAAQYVILADWVPEFAGDPKPPEPGFFDSGEEAKAKQEALAKWHKEQSTEREFEKEYLLAQAASILALMSTYVLPLLYGVLGTVAYILRSVSRGIRERVLTDATILNFWVRIPLGMLSGVAIGWFLSTDNLPTGWEAVQPLAFAFVAGYSVELIFTGMDRLVGAFTGRNQPGTP